MKTTALEVIGLALLVAGGYLLAGPWLACVVAGAICLLLSFVATMRAPAPKGDDS